MGVQEEVKEVVAEVLGKPTSNFSSTDYLLGGESELDSYSIIELITALELRFAINIPEDEISAEVFETVETLAQFVESLPSK